MDGIVAKGGLCTVLDSRGFTLIHHEIEPFISKPNNEASARQKAGAEMNLLTQNGAPFRKLKQGEEWQRGWT